VYAAYSDILVISAIIWGRIVDKKNPDRYEITDSIVASLMPLSYFMRHAEDPAAIRLLSAFST
jgi:drug/metabolite transporter superfamily protein YnfA